MDRSGHAGRGPNSDFHRLDQYRNPLVLTPQIAAAVWTKYGVEDAVSALAGSPE